VEEKIRPGYAALARGEVVDIVTGKAAKLEEAPPLSSFTGALAVEETRGAEQRA